MSGSYRFGSPWVPFLSPWVPFGSPLEHQIHETDIFHEKLEKIIRQSALVAKVSRKSCMFSQIIVTCPSFYESGMSKPQRFHSQNVRLMQVWVPLGPLWVPLGPFGSPLEYQIHEIYICYKKPDEFYQKVSTCCKSSRKSLMFSATIVTCPRFYESGMSKP